MLLFASRQNTITNSSGEFRLDKTSTECKISIFFKTYRSSRPEVFCEKGFLRNFTKFTEKHLCQSLFLNKVAVEHLWWLLLNVTILSNQMQPKTKKCFFNISVKGTLTQMRKSANILSPSQKNNMLQISLQNTFYFLRYANVRYVKSFFTNIQNNRMC